MAACAYVILEGERRGAAQGPHERGNQPYFPRLSVNPLINLWYVLVINLRGDDRGSGHALAENPKVVTYRNAQK